MRVLKYLLVALFAGVALQAVTASVQVPPTRFFGEIYINGQPAPAGTEVKAWVYGVECGTRITSDDGRYVVDAAHDATVQGCATEGSDVTFTINGVTANETGSYSQGT